MNSQQDFLLEYFWKPVANVPLLSTMMFPRDRREHVRRTEEAVFVELNDVVTKNEIRMSVP